MFTRDAGGGLMGMAGGPLKAGHLLDGDLIIGRMLGCGASSTVYEAFRGSLGERVAVKVIHGVHHSAIAEGRFRREATLCQRLDSPHVARVHEQGELESGTPYIVMDHIEGQTLEQRLAGGPLPVEEALDIAEQTLRALETAHAARILHRDIKPDNLLLTRDAEGRRLVKLVDFGIARPLDEAPTLTLEGVVLGTPCYMAPEQARGEPLDERADLYAVAILLHEMLAGVPPFDGETASEVMTAVQVQPLPQLSHTGRTLPPRLEAFVQKAAARTASERFQSAKEMGEALRALRVGSDPDPTELLRFEQRLRMRPKMIVAALAAAAMLGAFSMASRAPASEADDTPTSVAERNDPSTPAGETPVATTESEEDTASPRRPPSARQPRSPEPPPNPPRLGTEDLIVRANPYGG